MKGGRILFLGNGVEGDGGGVSNSPKGNLMFGYGAFQNYVVC